MRKFFALICLISIVLFGLGAVSSFAGDGDQVVVYYFYTTFRCASCMTIEKNTESALKDAFADAMASGRLVYKPLNIDEKENQHFAQDYQLYTKSVVLSLMKDGKETQFKNLDKVWQYLRNRDQFSAYIQQETENFLNTL